MLKSLKLKNFTVFSEADFEFSEGLNVVIGENGTGKSHLLKAAYAIAYVFYEEKGTNVNPDDEDFGKTVLNWGTRLKKKLQNVFKTESLYNLYKRQSDHHPTLVVKTFSNDAEEHIFNTFEKKVEQHIEILLYKGIRTFHKIPEGLVKEMPLFFPAKEILSIYPNFLSLYEKYHLAFDETYYDLCKALSGPLLKNVEASASLLESLENIIGGKVKLKSDRFYISFPEQDEQEDMEISLAAEGVRKVAMLAYLIANDSLKKGASLFWDEPETNLNPKIMKDVAAALVHLSKNGVQVIVATHNLFLMKELSMQADKLKDSKPARFFSLALEHGSVRIEQGERLTDLPTIVSLDEELALYDREQETFYYANKEQTG